MTNIIINYNIVLLNYQKITIKFNWTPLYTKLNYKMEIVLIENKFL